MIKILLLITGLLLCCNTFCQTTAKTDEFRTDLDRTINVRDLDVELAPKYVLSGNKNILRRVQVIDADTLYPRILVAEADTSGYSAGKAGDIFIDKLNNKVYISESAGRGKYILINGLLALIFIRRRKK